MSQLRLYPSVILAALLVLGIVLVGPASARATAAPPPVPEPIAAPSGSELLFMTRARGVQIYECVGGAWAFHAPRAVLFDPDEKGRTGIHYGGVDRRLSPGPWWESTRDGSRVRAAVKERAPSPNPESIPLLLLEVLESHGAGAFSPVRYIQRLNTVGGVGPSGPCAAGARRQVVYTADYYFYTAP